LETYPLIVIAGPTGSGKTELALRVAQQFHGEIVNCDSLQVYRGFDIGTAKLGPEERRGVPHHLIDILDPGELFTAGEYARRARPILHEIAGRARVPVIAGGTGFYLRALLEGLPPGPARHPDLRTRLLDREQKRPGAVYRLLTRLDGEAAVRIHVNDMNKTLRALELRLLRNAPAATQEKPERLAGFQVWKIGLNPPREALYEYLNQRLRRMFERGLEEEVRGLLARGVSPLAKPFESLGYKEVLLYLTGQLDREKAIEAAQIATRQYAKRQLTWFRREPDLHWFGGFGGDPSIAARICSFLGSAISYSNIS
jgi:tRNA dimethylallyltransferase